jgi:hypothetical protein
MIKVIRLEELRTLERENRLLKRDKQLLEAKLKKLERENQRLVLLIKNQNR